MTQKAYRTFMGLHEFTPDAVVRDRVYRQCEIIDVHLNWKNGTDLSPDLILMVNPFDLPGVHLGITLSLYVTPKSDRDAGDATRNWVRLNSVGMASECDLLSREQVDAMTKVSPEEAIYNWGSHFHTCLMQAFVCNQQVRRDEVRPKIVSVMSHARPQVFNLDLSTKEAAAVKFS